MLVHVPYLVELSVRLCRQILRRRLCHGAVQLIRQYELRISTQAPLRLITYLRHDHDPFARQLENLDGIAEVYFGEAV